MSSIQEHANRVVIEQASLLEWCRSQSGRRIMQHFTRDADVHFMHDGQHGVFPQEGQQELKSMLRKACVYPLAYGEPIFVADDPLELIHASAATIPDWPLHQSDLPVPTGFLLLARPIRDIQTGPHSSVDLHSFTWHSVPEHTLFVMVGWVVHRQTGSERTLVAPGPCMTWNFGQTLSQMIASTLASAPHDRHGNTEGFVAVTRYFVSALAFMSQRVLVVQRSGVSRSGRKLAERVGMTIASAGVRVVLLRRAKSHDPVEAASREYHVRWWVRGHWRQQPCGPQRELRRPTWVVQHIKGPDDAPLKPRDQRVLVVAR